MKQFVYITLLLLCGFLNSHAQEVSPWEEAYNNLPQKHRDEFYGYARDFLENTYYTQMSLAIEEGEMFCVNFIKNIFGDENEADAARFQPEFLIESLEEHFLTPDSYLQTLCNTFEESDELEFIVSNIEEDKYVHGYTSPFNCFTRLDYDLEIKRRGETLLKRRCRMYCLFPVVSYKLEVRLMQIEPLEDFYIASEFFPVSETQLQASDETRFQEAQEWYDQGLTEMYLPVFQELANKGYAAAQYYLGNCYENGIGVSKDGEKAVEWYTKAANQGDANAQKALERLKKPLRCQGFIKNEANIPLAGASVSYNYGTYNKGRYGFRGVSVKTDSNGYFSFGNNLPIGAVLKVTCVGYKPYTFRWEGGLADISLIEVLMCKGIVKNEIGTAIVGATISRDSEVYTSTGIDGRFCLENLPIGAVLKVTCVGYKPYTFRWEGGFADIILIEGDQVSDKAQLQEAVKWYNQGLTEKCLPIFQELAEKGNVMAQFYLGLSYDKGKGVLKNERNAMEWYTKAAEQGHIIAQYNLALCYRYDYKDARTAVEWYTKAAEQGYALAQNSLGYCYETGIGVPIDERKAIEWYTKAARQGMNEAKDALKRLLVGMEPRI